MATQAEFFSSLANLLKIGFSLTAALKFIRETDQTLKPGTEKIILNLQTGLGFSECAKPLISPSAYYQLMIAEKHGQLQSVLQELATFDRLKIKQIQKIKAMMVYPLFLCFILLLLVVLIHTVVFPQIATLLPEVSAANSSRINPIFLGIIGLFVALVFLMSGIYLFRQSPLKKAEILAKTPLLGPIFKCYLNYYLASNLAILLKNGLSVKEIYETFMAQNKNSIIYELGEKLHIALTNGSSLKKLLRTHQIIPREIIKFLNSGDTVSGMANSMTAYSKLMFEEMIAKTNKAIGFIQPTMFLIIGVTIVLTYFQLLMPIYNSVKGLY